MRNRFFFIILAALIIAAVGINLVHSSFFESQRLKLIDKQISESSEALLNSNLFIASTQDPKKIEDAISAVLGGARIGKVFVLRNEKAGILYESFNVGLLQTELPITPEWVAVATESEYIRVRNIRLRGSRKLVLQVGLVLDRNFLNWEIVDSRVVNLVSGIVLALFLGSVFLTVILLSPLRLLIHHLRETTSSLMNLSDVRPLPKRLRPYTQGFWARSDEFASLLNTVQKLTDRINLNYKLTRSWTLQMSHELKTPLAIIRAETEAEGKAGNLPGGYAHNVVSEVERMSEIIGQFLDWAQLENSQVQRDLHALKMRNVTENVIARVDKISPGRLEVNVIADFTVFANPVHLDQLISNLITNALKFSPPESKVDVRLHNRTLLVIDRGSGIPQEVVERLGEPFNIGTSRHDRATGTGLGLAWVSTVARLYQWRFQISKNAEGGTTAQVSFPEMDAILP